jgi:formylglycine-generating enzyme required for sulfatase activity
MELVKTVMPDAVQTDPAFPPVPAHPDQVLALAGRANLIEMPVERASVRFYHQLLQEYFAARQMLRRDPAGQEGHWRWPWLETEMPLWERPDGNVDPLPPPPPTGWEETTILAAGLAPENDDQLVRALTGVNPVLAGRCLHEGRVRVVAAVRREVIARLLEAIADPLVALRVRIAAGEVLGHLGDPRLGEMIPIPAGDFLMGGDEMYEIEKSQHNCRLQGYDIGKYPVTNTEYARFVETGGYREARWWTQAGWEASERLNWQRPHVWDDPRWNQPNQPVVGVSWYEAVAYCNWLRTERGRGYRLPTETEWEKASRGGLFLDGDASAQEPNPLPDRRYPWGDRFAPAHLNSWDGDQIVGKTTSVGLYPTGASPYGLQDCAGNVWEWCATRWEKSYPYDTREDEWQEAYLEGDTQRVLRGGSFAFDQRGARSAFRNWSDPHPRYSLDGFHGFRVVVSPSDSWL